MRQPIAVLVICVAASFGCDDPDKVEVTEPVDLEQPEAEPRAIESAEEEAPTIVSAAKVTRKMALWADAPEAIEQGPDTVVLQYVNFPGFYEKLDSSVVKECVLAFEKKPFDVVVYQYRHAGEDTFERITAIEPCPDLSEKRLGAQWLESELLRQAIDDPDRADPTTNFVGWAGRGFYRVDGADPEKTPLEGAWKTFCGPTSETPCTAVLAAE